MRWLLVVAFLPTPLFAEGAIQSWACAIERLCPSGAQCFDTNQFAIFIIEPVAVGPDGTGDFTVNRGDDTYPMQDLTGNGLLIWSEVPGDREILSFTGGNTFLWQRYKGQTDSTDIAFLTCEVTQ